MKECLAHYFLTQCFSRCIKDCLRHRLTHLFVKGHPTHLSEVTFKLIIYRMIVGSYIHTHLHPGQSEL